MASLQLQERLNQIKQRVAQQNDDNPAYQQADTTVSMDFSTFIYKCIKQRINPYNFFQIIKQCYSILKWILLEQKVIRKKGDIQFYTIIVNYITSLKIRVSPYENSDTQVIFEGVDGEIDRKAIAKVCLNFYESYLEFYLESLKSLSTMSYDTFYQKMEKYRRDSNQSYDILFKDSKSLTEEDIQLYMKDEEINDSIRAHIKVRQQAQISIKKYFISVIKNFDSDINKSEQSKVDVQKELEEYRQRKRQQIGDKQNSKEQKRNKLSSKVIEVCFSVLAYSIILYLIFAYIIKPYVL